MNNFDEILIQYKNYLYYLMSYYNIDTRDEDMYQRALIGLWKASITFDESKGIKFLTYASRIITNELFLEMRSHRKQAKLHLVPIDEPIKDTEDLTYQDLLPSLERTDSKILYYDIMNILTPEEQELLRYVVSGYSQPELGEIYCRTQSTMCKRIKRLRDKIDRYLKKSS